MFIPADRDVVMQRMLDLARADPAITGAAGAALLGDREPLAELLLKHWQTAAFLAGRVPADAVNLALVSRAPIKIDASVFEIARQPPHDEALPADAATDEIAAEAKQALRWRFAT
jgi:hypothetical protein